MKKGTGIETIRTIPAVLTLLELSGPDPYECAVLAASLGGDTDTIGAISCSICGTVHPDIDETLVSVLEQVNGIVFLPMPETWRNMDHHEQDFQKVF